jgi:hypothetical protein
VTKRLYGKIPHLPGSRTGPSDRHVDDALAAVSLTLSDKEIAFLEEPYQTRPLQF